MCWGFLFSGGINMNRNEQITKVTQEILEAFRTGQLAEPLAQTFLNHGLHCERWSINNQMVVHLLGYQDAATYHHWQEMGRQVKRGSRAFYLMKPHVVYRTIEDELTGEHTRVPAHVKGFGWFPVFAYESTLPLPGFQGEVYCLETIAQERQAFVAGLPLVEVAEAWGIHVTTYRGQENDAYGWAIPGRSIGLGVTNLSRWAHELVHRSFRSPSEAEHRLGRLTVGNGQDRENEIVAELGGAVLLTLLGHKVQADWGGAYRYIRSYANGKDNEGVLREVMRLTNRMAGAVRLILHEAGKLEPRPTENRLTQFAMVCCAPGLGQ
jgi:hypothetical protein